MTTTSVDEPKVSVHGIPQSQYEAQNPTGYSSPPVGSGTTPQPSLFSKIRMNIEQHWPVYTVIIGFATVGVMLLINRNNNNSQLATTTDQTNGGLSGTNYSGDQLYGQQLDASYQQLMSFQNTQIGVLQQILNKLQNPSANPPTGSTNNPNAGYTVNGQPGNIWVDHPELFPLTGYGTALGTTPNINNPLDLFPNPIQGTVRGPSTSSSSPTYNYDINHMNVGVPIENTPFSGSTIIGYLPYNSTTNIVGAQTGAFNFPTGGNSGTGGGSNIWYQLSSGGYVSQWDVGLGEQNRVINGVYTVF